MSSALSNYGFIRCPDFDKDIYFSVRDWRRICKPNRGQLVSFHQGKGALGPVGREVAPCTRPKRNSDFNEPPPAKFTKVDHDPAPRAECLYQGSLVAPMPIHATSLDTQLELYTERTCGGTCDRQGRWSPVTASSRGFPFTGPDPRVTRCHSQPARQPGFRFQRARLCNSIGNQGVGSPRTTKP